jgi:ubiquitin carboxyl-terminal hydrolase 47
VQEFCRVLFDKIDETFTAVLPGSAAESNSPSPLLKEKASMENFFKGMSASYVKCLNCGFERPTMQQYLDLSLPIKNEFGTGVLNSSVEMALENYIKPEELNGDN